MKLYNVALSKDKGSIAFNDSGTEGGSIFSKNHHKVETTPLDWFVKQTPVCTPGILNADIEDEEVNFLSGALQTTKRYRPVLLLSMYHNVEQFFEMKPLIEYLGLNYKFILRKLSFESAVSETILIAYPENLDRHLPMRKKLSEAIIK